MKNAEEILREQMGETRFRLNGSNEEIIAAMKAYASQALDEAASRVDMTSIAESESMRNKIIRIKSQLK